jgi:hypothetical protein
MVTNDLGGIFPEKCVQPGRAGQAGKFLKFRIFLKISVRLADVAKM